MSACDYPDGGSNCDDRAGQDNKGSTPVGDAMARLTEHAPLEPSPDKPHGHGPARYYKFRGAHIGFIGSVTCADFCTTCNKLRLTADGKLRPCPGRHGEIDLMPALRGDAAGITAAIEDAIANKPENHSFAECFEVQRPMTAIGG